MKKKMIIIIVVIVFVLVIGGVGIGFLINNSHSQEPEMVTITFIGKNEEIFRIETVEKGSFVEQRDPEETLGFSGWFTEEGVPFDFSIPVEENMTLHAEWGVIEENFELFLVLLVDNGYYSTLEVQPNEIIIPPEAPVKEGYTFVGWYENDILFDFTKPITKDHTLNAVFTPNN